jgi:hypothetical protein
MFIIHNKNTSHANIRLIHEIIDAYNYFSKRSQ